MSAGFKLFSVKFKISAKATTLFVKFVYKNKKTADWVSGFSIHAVNIALR